VTLGLSDLGDRLRYVSNEIEVVAVPHPMPKLPVARAVWRPLPDFATSTQCWLAAGGPHHTVLSTQLNATHLQDLAKITGVELALIARDTKERDFTHALAWTAAAYRLGIGRLGTSTSWLGDFPFRRSKIGPHRLRAEKVGTTCARFLAVAAAAASGTLAVRLRTRHWHACDWGLRLVRRRCEGNDRRCDADQDLRAVDQGRRQHQASSSRPPATRSTSSTPTMTSRPRSPRSTT